MNLCFQFIKFSRNQFGFSFSQNGTGFVSSLKTLRCSSDFNASIVFKLGWDSGSQFHNVCLWLTSGSIANIQSIKMDSAKKHKKLELLFPGKKIITRLNWYKLIQLRLFLNSNLHQIFIEDQKTFFLIAMCSHVEGFCNWSYHLEWFSVILEDP
jgi:hypothetical protein